MYRTYARFKDHFADRMRLLYTDTDSFIIQLTGSKSSTTTSTTEIDRRGGDSARCSIFSNVPAGPRRADSHYPDDAERLQDRILQKRDQNGPHRRSRRAPAEDVQLHRLRRQHSTAMWSRSCTPRKRSRASAKRRATASRTRTISACSESSQFAKASRT